MQKVFLFRTLIVALMISLLLWDGFRLIFHNLNAVPQQHKELLFIGALLWIATVFINQGSNDDDWAGQY